MNEEEKRIGQKLMPYRFWLFLVLSAFLIVTFVFYLPLWFQHQAVPHGSIEIHDDGIRAMHEEHGAAVYHEESEAREGLAVNLNVTPVPVKVGLPVRLDFFLNEKPMGEPIPAESLEIEHTKLMHVIGVRNDMNEFFHIHPLPTAAPGILSVEHVFSNPGVYKIWSEIKKGGVNHAFGHLEIDVEGEGVKEEKEVSFGRNMVVDNYEVSLELQEPVAKGHEHDLTFDIHTLTGQEIQTEDFLGASMHLTIIKDDLKQFIHTHPEELGEDHEDMMMYIPIVSAHGLGEESVSPGEDETINFHVTFPEPAFYKAFAQFRPQGSSLPPDEALLASFWIKVEEKSVVKLSKGMLVSISFLLIVILSWGIRRFLQVKT